MPRLCPKPMHSIIFPESLRPAREAEYSRKSHGIPERLPAHTEGPGSETVPGIGEVWADRPAPEGKDRGGLPAAPRVERPAAEGVDGLPADQQAEQLAAEQVMAQMLSDIPLLEDRPAHAEPPDDLSE